MDQKIFLLVLLTIVSISEGKNKEVKETDVWTFPQVVYGSNLLGLEIVDPLKDSTRINLDDTFTKDDEHLDTITATKNDPFTTQTESPTVNYYMQRYKSPMLKTCKNQCTRQSTLRYDFTKGTLGSTGPSAAVVDLCGKLFPELFTSDVVLETILGETGTKSGTTKNTPFDSFCQKLDPDFIKSMVQTGKSSATPSASNSKPAGQSVNPQLLALWKLLFPNLFKTTPTKDAATLLVESTNGITRYYGEQVAAQYIAIWQVLYPNLFTNIGTSTSGSTSSTQRPTTTKKTTTAKPSGPKGPSEKDRGPNNRTRRPPKYKKGKNDNCKNPPKKHPPKSDDEDEEDENDGNKSDKNLDEEGEDTKNV